MARFIFQHKVGTILFMYLLIFNYSNTSAQILLNQFAAFETKGTVSLFWQIAAGNTCIGTTIQHATDSNNFNTVGNIAGICGSTSEPTNYNFQHINPAKNKVNYYRLLLGNISSSEIITILVIDVGTGYLLHQNPVSEKAVIYFSNDNNILHNISVFNLGGFLLFSMSTNESFFQITTDAFANGQYLFVISTESNKPAIKGKFSVLNF